MLECLGDKPCHFILIFDNGYFSEFGTFSITDWLGHTPKALLAKNFGLPESAFDGFPKEEVYFARGRSAPREDRRRPLQAGTDAAARRTSSGCSRRSRTRSTRGAASGGSAPTGFPISQTVTGVILDLEPGGLRELHWHPTADEWQYVIEGQVSVTLFGSHGRYRTETLDKGDVGYIPQGYGHSIENIGNQPCRMLIGFNTRPLRGDRPVASGSPATRSTCWPPISASRRRSWRSSRTSGSSSPRPRPQVTEYGRSTSSVGFMTIPTGDTPGPGVEPVRGRTAVIPPLRVRRNIVPGLARRPPFFSPDRSDCLKHPEHAVDTSS